MITELRKGMAVKRYHTQPRVQEETVGHHSANVCAILLRLDPNVSRELLVAALMHDVVEAYTGDIPATAKWDHPALKDELDFLEVHYTTKYDVLDPRLREEEYALLKLADMMDLVMSSLEEVNKGNQYAKKVVSNGMRYIMGLQLPVGMLGKALEMISEVKDECK